jgi:3-oxoadipate enol-lactonase
MTLGYEEQGAGPAVFMVHGLGGSSNTFQPQALSLAKSYRVIRPDLPGAGRSLALPAGTIVTVADQLVELAAKLGVSNCHWVGHSLGTVICQVLATRHPALVKSLALLGPIAEAAPPARVALTGRAERVRQEGLDWFVDTYIANSIAKAVTESNPAVGAFLRESLMRQSPSHYADFCVDLAAHQAVPLSSIHAPTLLVTGDEDKVGTIDSVNAMSTALPHADMLVLSSCGHWLTVERPKEVTAALESHLRKADASTK